MNGITVAKLLRMIQSSVSKAVQRSENLALENKYSLYAPFLLLCGKGYFPLYFIGITDYGKKV